MRFSRKRANPQDNRLKGFLLFAEKPASREDVPARERWKNITTLSITGLSLFNPVFAFGFALGGSIERVFDPEWSGKRLFTRIADVILIFIGLLVMIGFPVFLAYQAYKYEAIIKQFRHQLEQMQDCENISCGSDDVLVGFQPDQLEPTSSFTPQPPR